MCGINGFVSLGEACKEESERRSIIEKMNQMILHRGPDAKGVFSREGMTFGFRRLSIIDLRESANQPMLSDDMEVVLVFNGEIYNYLEIREELRSKGHRFRTESDTEVIIRSYLEYGDRCVEHFNGMWAFALYDFRKNRLFCSRDRLGVKPFYYSLADDHLIFSSELKAIQAVKGSADANLAKVYEYLAYGYRINDGETFFDGVSELLPGTNLICQNGDISLVKYWKLTENLFEHDANLSLFEEYEALFKDAVKLRYRSDVPVALLLSGGLDSTAIARVTNDLINDGSLPQNEVHAFVASFPNYKFDETKKAREFAKTCSHIVLHEMVIDSEEVIDKFEDTVHGLDHPLGSFASMAHHSIMKACKDRGIKVVLNGQGSDEAFAGYDRFISGAHLLDQALQRKGNFFSEFRCLNKYNGYSPHFLLSQMFKTVVPQPYASFLRAKFMERSISCLNADFVRQNRDHYKSEYNFSIDGNNLSAYLLNQINHQGLNTILHYEDVSSMQQSIEIRSPFLDYRMMEFAFSIPNRLKFTKGITKFIQRETIGRKLPASIVGDRQKIGFSTPFNDYIANHLGWKSYVRGVVESESFKSRGIWMADKLKKRFIQPDQFTGFPFWRVLNLEVWARAYGVTNL